MKKFKTCFLLFCITIMILSGCGMREEAKVVSAEGSTDSAIEQENSFSGRAEASETVKVVSKQSGKVSEIFVDIGSDVEKGQTLFQLDARDLAANVEAMRASLDTAQIAYGTALDNQKRAETLEENGAMSYADYENNYLNVLKRAEAAVDLAKANLDKAEVAYQDSVVTAPISGTVTDVIVKAGEMVSPQVASIVLVNLDEIKIKLYVSEKKINSLAAGQSCKVEFSAMPDQQFDGVISSISDAMDETSKGYLVNVAVKNSNHKIKNGMFAKVYL